MKIIKVLNNNVALVHDELGFEQVVMGRGLAFRKHPGDRIDPQNVDKIFVLQDQGSDCPADSHEAGEVPGAGDCPR